MASHPCAAGLSNPESGNGVRQDDGIRPNGWLGMISISARWPGDGYGPVLIRPE